MNYDRSKYVLDEKGEPAVEPDLTKWAMWFEKADRKVASDVIGPSRVSTVFLALNHNFSEGGQDDPILWETMVFGGPCDQDIARCSGGRAQAQEMHADMVARVLGREE